ncbi:MAG: IS21/IS408/IS1162 family transposase, partial [Thermocrispum sp.]
MTEIREVLRAWLAGKGLRRVAEQAGVDRKTARRFVEAAVAAGLVRDGGEGQLSDELIGQVVEAVRPSRPQGRGAAWEALEAWREQIVAWVGKDLTVVKIGELLARQGVAVPHRTLHRFCVERTDYRGRGARDTVRVADGTPGEECQIDFAKMGLLYDPSAGRRRSVHALIFTAVFSRHMFVWLTFAQTLDAVVAGCEAAWRFFDGVFGVLIPDNASAIVAKADAVNPQFTVGWLEYAQARGFVTDAARVRSPQDKPRVERTVQYVRGNFFAGETFVDLADAQARAETWCAQKAGLRLHGTIQARPAEVFAEHEAGVLLAAPEQPYEVPIYATVKVHRDYHVQLGKALYSAPKAYLGQQVTARADGELVKLFHRGQLIKTHPRQRPGGRSTDAEDLPAEKVGYAMRDLDRLIRAAAGHGANVGIYAERLLDDKLPWTRMRQVYRL